VVTGIPQLLSQEEAAVVDCAIEVAGIFGGQMTTKERLQVDYNLNVPESSPPLCLGAP
jgi:hypothetical protein